MKCIRPKSWRDFQHYTNRAPIWIKLHRRLLDDFEFNSLPVASKALAPMLWLLASEYAEGDIPADTRKIAFRLRMTVEDLDAAFQPLLSAGFFSVIGEDGKDASVPLAEPEPNAIPEKETQVTSDKRETEKKVTPRSPKKASATVTKLPDFPDWIPLEAWDAFVEMRRKIRAPLTSKAVSLAVAELENLRAQGHDPGAVLDQSVLRSWRGLFEIGAKNVGRRDGFNGKSTSQVSAEFLAGISAGDAGADRCPPNGALDPLRPGLGENGGGMARSPAGFLPGPEGKN